MPCAPPIPGTVHQLQVSLWPQPAPQALLPCHSPALSYQTLCCLQVMLLRVLGILAGLYGVLMVRRA